MIVKNEEKNIEQALSWGKGVVCEQIVVDTGSTDRTVSLAEAMGAKVYHFPWIDDFSAAKNFAISKAEGDWIAFLDADEYIAEEEAKKLPPLLNQLDRTHYAVLLTAWIHVDSAGKVFSGGVQTRIFKNMEGLRYKNRIHEELVLNGKGIFRDTVDASEEIAIFHNGYAPDAGMSREKGERNARLIRMELEEHPDNFNMMGYLGDSFYAIGEDLDEAEYWYRKAISLMPEHIYEDDMRSAATFWKLMMILYEKNDENGLMEIYEKAVRLIPKESDFDYIVGEFYKSKKDFKKGALYLERALDKVEKYGRINGGELITGRLQGTWELLAACHYQNGDFEKCTVCCTSLLKEDRYLMSTLVMMLCAFKQENTGCGAEDSDTPYEAEVAGFLSRLYDFTSLKDRIFLLRAAMKAEYGALVKKIRESCSKEELACFDQSMRLHSQ